MTEKLNIKILEELALLAAQWREKHIPILSEKKAVWLAEFVAKNKPARVLEIGTAVGYSGTILSSCGAQLVTIDKDETALAVAQETFSQFGVDAQIISEDATEALRDIATLGLIPGEFDMIFIDHGKAQYMDALEYCIALSHSGTSLVADNIKNPKCSTFVAAIKSDERLETTFFDIDDGMSVSVVKNIKKK